MSSKESMLPHLFTCNNQYTNKGNREGFEMVKVTVQACCRRGCYRPASSGVIRLFGSRASPQHFPVFSARFLTNQ